MGTDDRESWLQRIGELVDRAAYRQALKVCDQALVAHPDLAEAHDFRGLILCRMGRYREALPAYDRAIRLEPDFMTALLDKAELLVFYLHEDEEAIALTDRVLRLSSQDLDSAHAHHLKGIAYANLGLHEEALRNFDVSVSLDGEYPDTQCERGVSLFESYRFSESLRALKASASMDPSYARPHYFLAALYEHLGEAETARREQEVAAQLDPESHAAPPSLDEADFAAALEEARHTLPREVRRLLEGGAVETEWLPPRDLMAEGAVRPSACSYHEEREGRLVVRLFQRNVERLVRTRAELVDEIAHAVSHELGHPEAAGRDPHAPE
jgi:tetratricopeptide (TPR) repeat protein